MFGLFRNREKFNDEVNQLLNSTLGINTNSRVNEAFPGVLVYLGYIDEVWHGKGTSEDAALRIGCLYFMGISKNGSENERMEARLLHPKLLNFLEYCRNKGSIADFNLKHYAELIEKYAKEYGTNGR